MTANFYDKMAKKFGGYGFNNSPLKYTSEYPSGNPEEVFKEKIITLAGKDKKILDVGCGDGIFAFDMAKYYMNVTGIDFSKGLLEVAKQKQNELKIKNCVFEFQDAEHTSFADNSFDVIFSRRGPTPYSEFYRLLKPNGHFVIITIGEKDTQALKETFGRGQNYSDFNISRLKTDREIIENLGFKTIFAQDYYYDEYYPSYYDIDLFLQSVPIFEDFDSEKDRQFLEKYVTKFTTKKGIKLSRHRVIIVAQK